MKNSRSFSQCYLVIPALVHIILVTLILLTMTADAYLLSTIWMSTGSQRWKKEKNSQNFSAKFLVRRCYTPVSVDERTARKYSTRWRSTVVFHVWSEYATWSHARLWAKVNLLSMFHNLHKTLLQVCHGYLVFWQAPKVVRPTANCIWVAHSDAIKRWFDVN
jgi:hypothetical protein